MISLGESNLRIRDVFMITETGHITEFRQKDEGESLSG